MNTEHHDPQQPAEAPMPDAVPDAVPVAVPAAAPAFDYQAPAVSAAVQAREFVARIFADVGAADEPEAAAPVAQAAPAADEELPVPVPTTRPGEGLAPLAGQRRQALAGAGGGYGRGRLLVHGGSGLFHGRGGLGLGLVGAAHVGKDARDEFPGLRGGGHRGRLVVEGGRGSRGGHRHSGRGGIGHGGLGRLLGVVRLVVHRSFSVDRPMRHSSMVMIQKRTTTCVSFQPLFSK